ncbi:MAG: hypothetical protein R3D34_16900 [Nitratireductor sp.]
MKIPSQFPFRIEVWSRDGSRLEETIAASSSLHIAIAAFDAACLARPAETVMLCNLAQIIRKRDPAACI